MHNAKALCSTYSCRNSILLMIHCICDSEINLLNHTATLQVCLFWGFGVCVLGPRRFCSFLLAFFLMKCYLPILFNFSKTLRESY